MFCPRCATQNSDDVKYCRACREDLKVIAQAMTRRLPVVLASKLDELLERRNERLRRDAVLNYVFGVSFLLLGALGLLTSIEGTVPVVACMVAFYQFGWGIWYTLAYKRSLTQNPKPTSLISESRTIYCPRCGKLNNDNTKFCHSCGENLSVIARAMIHRCPTALTRRLDKFIERANDRGRILRQCIGMAVLGVMTLFVGIIKEGWMSAGFTVLGCILFMASLWDIIVYKRSLSHSLATESIGPGTTATSQSWTHNLEEATTRQLQQVTEQTTEKIGKEK